MFENELGGELLGAAQFYRASVVEIKDKLSPLTDGRHKRVASRKVEKDSPIESVLFAFVFRRCHDPIGNRPDIHHDGDPVDREEEKSEASRAGGDQESQADRQRRAEENQEEPNQPIALVDVSEPRDDAQHHRDHIAGLAFRGFQESGRCGRGGERLCRFFCCGCVCVFQSNSSAGYRHQRTCLRQGRCDGEISPRFLHFNFAQKLQNSGMPSLTEMVGYADKALRVAEIEDYPNALNGLQIENSGEVTKIGAAVDASGHTMQIAAEREVDLLVVHHGLFWPGLQRVTGPHYRALKLALAHNLALYSAHLPLDLHPTIGNNVLLAAALGLEVVDRLPPRVPDGTQPATELRAERTA